MRPITQDEFSLLVHPVTPDCWTDLELLFGPRGACGGCWCMYWKQTRSEYERLKGEGNRLALQKQVCSGEIPGLIAYLPQDSAIIPIGWIAIAPREDFPTLQRSRVLKPVDDQPVWSIVCFFTAKNYRRQGISSQLIQAAVNYAVSKGASIIEGYPVEPRGGKYPDVFIYTGLPGPFLKAGFIEVARRSETRPIMRYYSGDGK